MRKKSVTYLILSLILISILVPASLSEEDNSWWHDWSYRQEIEIPIDTSVEQAKHQPIDQRIEFYCRWWWD